MGIKLLTLWLMLPLAVRFVTQFHSTQLKEQKKDISTTSDFQDWTKDDQIMHTLSLVIAILRNWKSNLGEVDFKFHNGMCKTVHNFAVELAKRAESWNIGIILFVVYNANATPIVDIPK